MEPNNEVGTQEEAPRLNRAQRREQAKSEREQPRRMKAWRERVTRLTTMRQKERNRRMKIEKRRERKAYAAKLERAPIEGIAQAHLEHRESRYDDPATETLPNNQQP